MINELLISAKEFANELTTHNVIRKGLKGKLVISKEIVKNNKAIRNILLHRGVKPETLHPEDIKRYLVKNYQ